MKQHQNCFPRPRAGRGVVGSQADEIEAKKPREPRQGPGERSGAGELGGIRPDCRT